MERGFVILGAENILKGDWKMDVKKFWAAVLGQDAGAMRPYFHEDARVNWHNTNEQFTVEEFIRANCEYPGQWDGEVERVVEQGGLVITATRVWAAGGGPSFHVVSFIQLREERIISVDEYWGDDGAPPQWRVEKQIGRAIPMDGKGEGAV